MSKPLLSEENSTMQVPSAPPAYDDEFRPPLQNPPPYNPQVVEGQIQTAPHYTAAPYPQQVYAQPPPQLYPVMTHAPQPSSQSYPVVSQQPQQTQIVTQTERVILGTLPVGPRPLTTTCPHCQASIKTRTNTTTQCSAHIICLLLFFTLCWCYSCIPYCMDSFHTVHHHCPNCKAFLGSYQKH